MCDVAVGHARNEMRLGDRMIHAGACTSVKVAEHAEDAWGGMGGQVVVLGTLCCGCVIVCASVKRSPSRRKLERKTRPD